MITIDRLQRYLRLSAAQGREVLAVPPFSLFLHPTETAAAENVAIPNTAPTDAKEIEAALQRVRRACAARQRRAAFRFLDTFAPQLASGLAAAGLRETERVSLLACSPDLLRPAPPVEGLGVVTLTADSPIGEVQEGLDTNALGFDPQAARATPEEAESFRRELVTNQAFTARLGGVPAAAGMYNPPIEGIAELVGITTLEMFRGRGIAAALVGAIAQAAFERGVEIAFLTANTPVARRVYERVGFQPVACQITMVERESAMLDA